VEHKLIKGGEQYLPFARSRIKALRALGLAHASQKFLMPDGMVRVSISGEQDYINLEGGGGPMWVLVTAMVRPGAFAAVSEIHTRLYQMPLSLKAKSAVQRYVGSTVKTVETTTAYGTDNPPDPPDNQYVSSVVDFDTDSGALGAISGAAPYKGKALLWANRWTLNLTRTQVDNVVTAEDIQAKRSTTLKLGSTVTTFEANQNSAFGVVTFTGQFATGAPRVLAPGLACFKVLNIADSFYPVSGDYEFKKMPFDEDDHSPVDDQNGIDAIFPLAPRSPPYTRREVGSVTQGEHFIFENRSDDDAKKYSRAYGFLRAASDVDANFFTDTTVVVPTDDGPSSICFSVVDYDGDEINRIDLSELPGLAGAPVFSQALTNLSTWTQGSSDSFAPVSANFSDTLPWALGLTGLFQAGYPNGSSAEIVLKVQFIPDQALYWPNTEEA